MWWSDTLLRRHARAALAFLVAAPVGACFQPLNSQVPLSSGANLQSALASIDVRPIPAARGSTDERVAVEVRNALIFNLTGGTGMTAPAHRLNIRMTTSKSALIVDIATGRTEAEVTGIDVVYTLTELATNRVVVNGTGFARVSSDVPGLEQRFANDRALRDAEERAANVVADQIRSRLASYLVAGT
jgi:LPS-assembly lipoprotein